MVALKSILLPAPVPHSPAPPAKRAAEKAKKLTSALGLALVRLWRSHRAALTALTLSALLCVVGAVVFRTLPNSLLSQRAAERFAGESGERVSQVSAFLPAGTGAGMNEAYELMEALDSAYLSASITAEDGGRLYSLAWSAPSALTVTGTRGSAEAQVLGVGGDYFTFHPFYLYSGSFLGEDDLMHDRVVLDAELAWRLFGGFDLAGMTVTIDEKPYYIAGVVARESDFADKSAYTGGAGMYMFYDTLSELNGTEINTFEIVGRDPNTGFLSGIIKEELYDAETLENSGRFSFEAVLSVLGSFGERSQRTAAVSYPYWENAARLTEDWLALVLVLTMLFGLAPAAFIAVLAVRGIVRGCARVKAALPVLAEQQRERRYEKRYGKEALGSGGRDPQECKKGL
ncbi:MAG: ABC transporter permease [Oscillospiraceae bacterium]|nr:ABC transporter permease [Oscillospiraceae bacterium]